MPGDLIEVGPPSNGVYRLARRPGAAFAPPPWSIADPADGTFGNRFDDPDAMHATDRFRTISCATERICTFMESLARFRPSLDVTAITEMTGPGGRDPFTGIVPADWRQRRQVGHVRLDPTLRFVDIAATATLSHLRTAMAADAHDLGLHDIDLSAVTGPQRALTQRIARYIYEQVDASGTPRFAGIRYLSRFGDEQECWAIFDTRMVTVGTVIVQAILPDDRDLRVVADTFGLTIEAP